ncbi:hypothetical protein KAR91_26175 [Candidatus Pacearchaeota archaeon]|nr:hypothetical protein [Candidatus Pacearchaeota archaeon]
MPSVEIKLVPIRVPNFIIVKMPPGKKEDGINLGESPKFALRDLDSAVLSDLCDNFRRDIFEKAGKDDPNT